MTQPNPKLYRVWMWGKRWAYCPQSVERVEEDYTQSTFCYCPICRHELVSDPDAFVYDKEWVRYRCPQCKTYSDWHFDAPIPLLLLHFGGHKEHLDRRLADGWYALHFCQQCREEWNQEQRRNDGATKT
ncbi:hypothetical protein LCGC14_1570930 [marine sediment metagenome]|uniref:Uncharacterized protein n=1 Tax=marine sediment metagenome TaxID=412755 RepID=A0A0F9L0V7_9ZZZZ